MIKIILKTNKATYKFLSTKDDPITDLQSIIASEGLVDLHVSQLPFDEFFLCVAEIRNPVPDYNPKKTAAQIEFEARNSVATGPMKI